MDFVSIDVETANRTRASICAIGIAVFKNWQLVDQKYYLVNPETEFDQMNILIHKIKPEDVADAPKFTDIYPELKTRLHKQTVISYTLFDQSALERTLERYDTESINYADWIDVCEEARCTWPQLKNHKLKTVAKELCLPPFEHHNALADACAVGLVFTHSAKETPLPEKPARKAAPRAKKQTAPTPPATVVEQAPAQKPKPSYAKPILITLLILFAVCCILPTIFGMFLNLLGYE